MPKNPYYGMDRGEYNADRGNRTTTPRRKKPRKGGRLFGGKQGKRGGQLDQLEKDS